MSETVTVEVYGKEFCFERVNGEWECSSPLALQAKADSAIVRSILNDFLAEKQRADQAEEENSELKEAVKTLVINCYEDVDDQHHDLVRGDDLLQLNTLAMRKLTPTPEE